MPKTKLFLISNKIEIVVYIKKTALTQRAKLRRISTILKYAF